MASPQALIVGGSVGGLFTAHLLRSIGWQVTVFERIAEDLASRGAGIGTQDALHDVMRRLGLPIDDTMGVEVRSCICLDRAGQVVHEQPIRRVMSAWSRVYQPLRDALPADCYRAGWRFEQAQTDGARVLARFANGETAEGDLLVGADGIRSAVRAQLLPGARPVYAGYVAWRGMAEEQDIPPDLRCFIFDRYTFCLPPGEMLLAYPVPARDGSTARGRRGYNVVWYRPIDDSRLTAMCTDATGRQHEGAIPPPLIRPEVLAEMRADAQAKLAPQIAAIIRHAAQPFFQPIYDLVSPRLVFGRVALLGDAAFVARPHVGAGVTKAALDAACLADSLAAAGGDIDAGLARYNDEQVRFGEWIVARSRELGAQVTDTGDARAAQVMREHSAANADLRGQAAGRARRGG